MDRQEAQIIRLLLNEMAFEGASKHFQEEFPDIDIGLFADLERVGAPQKYQENNDSYRNEGIEFDKNACVFENCYRYLRVIRNNIIHANKAYQPDSPGRLTDLLDWSDKFIAAVYSTGSPFAERARQIKSTLRISEF